MKEKRLLDLWDLRKVGKNGCLFSQARAENVLEKRFM